MRVLRISVKNNFNKTHPNICRTKPSHQLNSVNPILTAVGMFVIIYVTFGSDFNESNFVSILLLFQ